MSVRTIVWITPLAIVAFTALCWLAALALGGKFQAPGALIGCVLVHLWFTSRSLEIDSAPTDEELSTQLAAIVEPAGIPPLDVRILKKDKCFYIRDLGEFNNRLYVNSKTVAGVDRDALMWMLVRESVRVDHRAKSKQPPNALIWFLMIVFILCLSVVFVKPLGLHTAIAALIEVAIVVLATVYETRATMSEDDLDRRASELTSAEAGIRALEASIEKNRYTELRPKLEARISTIKAFQSER